MKVESVKLLEVVDSSEVAPISQTNDPLSTGRLPIGYRFRTSPTLHWVQPSGAIRNRWQAVVALPENENAPYAEGYTISPRVFQGIAFVGKKPTFVAPRNFPRMPLVDLLAKQHLYEVTGYESKPSDNFDTGKTESKEYLMIKLVSNPTVAGDEVEFEEIPATVKTAKPLTAAQKREAAKVAG